MMKDFNNDSFESFLKQSADEVRMRPSQRVWANISANLNKRKRWFGFGLFFLSASLISFYFTHDGSFLKPIPTSTVHHDKAAGFAKPATESLKKQNSSQHFASKFNSVIEGSKNQNPVRSTASVSNTPALSSPVFNIEDPILLPGSIEQNESTSILLTGTAILPKTKDKTFTIAERELLGLKQVPNLPAKSLIEEAAQLNKLGKKKHKLQFETFFTPTISYRKLSENSKLAAQQRSLSLNYVTYDNNINSLVTQKPNMGLELAFITKYPVSKKVSLRSGVQFNMSRYDIKALTYVPELTTISISGPYSINAVNAVSKYRNVNSLNANWLQNLFLQISVPVGLEVYLGGTDKVHFGIAGTLQPTYVLSNKAYLLSSNYKNYVEAPWLVRHWNANTSFETFMAYSTGRLQWQVGPQIRYQLLSSFKNKYPVKENLYDFGFKVGVSLNHQ